jgi:deazaflavin-dependent oxidoreductase (nitroreductase family)
VSSRLADTFRSYEFCENVRFQNEANPHFLSLPKSLSRALGDRRPGNISGQVNWELRDRRERALFICKVGKDCNLRQPLAARSWAFEAVLKTIVRQAKVTASRRKPMPEYIPSPRDWVREQVELYERTNGAKGNTLRDTGLPVIIVTHVGNKTGAIRKTPLMRVKDGANYVLVGSVGGAPKDPVWVHNLRSNPQVELRDLAVVKNMRVREVTDTAERERLWKAAVAAYPPYAEYQTRTTRIIPIFVAEPVS